MFVCLQRHLLLSVQRDKAYNEHTLYLFSLEVCSWNCLSQCPSAIVPNRRLSMPTSESEIQTYFLPFQCLKQFRYLCSFLLIPVTWTLSPTVTVHIHRERWGWWEGPVPEAGVRHVPRHRCGPLHALLRYRGGHRPLASPRRTLPQQGGQPIFPSSSFASGGGFLLFPEVEQYCIHSDLPILRIFFLTVIDAGFEPGTTASAVSCSISGSNPGISRNICCT